MSFLTSYNLCISTPISTLETTIFTIHNRKSNVTICDLIQRPKVLKVFSIGLHPFKVVCGFLGKPENGLCTWSNNLEEVDTEMDVECMPDVPNIFFSPAATPP